MTDHSPNEPIESRLPLFELQPGETIVFQTPGTRPWILVGWKVLSSLITIAMITLIAWFLFAEPITGLLSKVIPLAAASVLAKILCFGLIPMLTVAWVVEDLFRAIVGKFVLTDKRLWVRGSPYAWNITETPLDDIDSLVFRRDAVFIHRRSTRRMLVHMLPDGKFLAKAYQDFINQKR